MTETNKVKLITALYNEYCFLCHDDFDPDHDITPQEYLSALKEMTHEELLEETCTDEHFTLPEYLETWA